MNYDNSVLALQQMPETHNTGSMDEAGPIDAALPCTSTCTWTCLIFTWTDVGE